MAEVLVIGGANVDTKAKCLGQHLPGNSNIAHIANKPGGVARNIAHNLARLGAKVSLITAVGQDDVGESLLAVTAKAGVDISAALRVAGQNTGTYIAMLSQDGELITAANDMAVLKAITPEMISSLAEKVQRASLVLADCNLEQETLAAIAKMAAHKLVVEPVSIEKSKRLKTLLGTEPIYLATPNLDQMFALSHSRSPEEAADILHQQGLQNVVIHAGRQGAHVSNGKSVLLVPPKANTIMDVTGAGDAATAGLLYGLMCGLPLVKSAELGQEVAARVLASHASTLE
jgi:pseudouridine kinase